MKNKEFCKIIGSMGIMILLLSLLSSCKDDDNLEYTDLFRPKVVNGYPKVEANTFKLMWYKVNNAISYTIELSSDEEFHNILYSETTEDLKYKSPKLPYATKFFVRLRTNAKYEDNNSIWATLYLQTEDREIPAILYDIEDDNIKENSVTINWLVDEAYPVDSISVERLDPLDDETYQEPIEYKLTPEEGRRGEFEITQLEEATRYKVTVCNSLEKDKYDRPYNSITFKTAGPPDGAIVITAAEDFGDILITNENDATINDGQVYYIKDGGVYNIPGYEFTKGFEVIGAPGADPELHFTTPFTPKDTAGKIKFSNVIISGESRFIYNEVDDGKKYVWEGVEIIKSIIQNFGEGFIILRTSTGSTKIIRNVIVDNCIVQNMQGGRFFETNNFSDATPDQVQIDQIIIQNSTFMNSTQMPLIFMPDAYGNSGGTISLVMRNVTVYEALGNGRVIQMNKLSSTSSVIITKCLLSNDASARDETYMFYETCLCGKAKKTCEDNYITGSRKESQKGGNINAQVLNVSQDELFADHHNGDLSIKDVTSVVYTDNIGDPRWLK